MPSDEQAIDMLSLLQRKTKDGDITWNFVKSYPSDIFPEDSKDIVFYGTLFNGKNIGVFKYRTPQRAQGAFVAVTGFKLPITGWTTKYDVALFSQEWDFIWNFPLVSGKKDLFEAVQYRVSGIDDFFSILDEQHNS